MLGLPVTATGSPVSTMNHRKSTAFPVAGLLAVFLVLSPRTQEDPFTPETVIDLVFPRAVRYFDTFRHPETGVLYQSPLAGKAGWTTPAEVLAEKPVPWGYGSHIADTCLHTGHVLGALLDAHDARPDPFLERQIRACFEALKFIGSLPERYPKPGKPALEGLAPRGPHPDDPAAYYDDSSMDQHTTYMISLALFAGSPLATAEDRAWIRQSLGKAGKRLEGNGWGIFRADGVTRAHVGFSWTGFNSSHASILLPTVLALYRGTGDEHWREQYEFFLSEADGRRWEQVHPGPHVTINAHPIYANQNAFRLRAWHQFEPDPERRKVIAGLLKQSAELQLGRDFPGEMYRKYQTAETWERVRNEFGWGVAELHGARAAWEKFTPSMLESKDRALATLAHVRFPLGGFYMVLLSEQPGLIRQYWPATWQMLTTVPLEKISTGETQYLFTVVGLHAYALYFRHPEWLAGAGTAP